MTQDDVGLDDLSVAERDAVKRMVGALVERDVATLTTPRNLAKAVALNVPDLGLVGGTYQREDCEQRPTRVAACSQGAPVAAASPVRVVTSVSVAPARR
jgi:hypothetical protein